MKNQIAKAAKRTAKGHKFPSGWDEKRVRKVLDHYENQTEDEAVAEDEAAFKTEGQSVMVVPTELVPAIQKLITCHRGK